MTGWAFNCAVIQYLTLHEKDDLKGADQTGTDSGYRFNGLEDGFYNLMVDYKGIPMQDDTTPLEIGSA